ncbi:MAG: single-stranded DNA-binding protein [Thermus sp.]
MRRVEEKPVARKVADHEVWLSGALTEVDLRYTSAGTAVLLLTLAGEVDQEGFPRPYYLQVKLLKERAERWADRLKRGTAVLARGVLTQYRSEGKTYTGILVRELRLLDPGKVAYSEPDRKGNRREARALNRFLGTGLLVSQPEVRAVKDGHVARARVLFQSGGEEGAVFITLEAWDGAALEVSDLSKGTPIFLEGRLKNDSWTDREGNRRFELRVEASWVKPLARPIREEAQEEENLPPDDLPPDDLPF